MNPLVGGIFPVLTVVLILTTGDASAAATSEAPLPRDQWGAPQVTVAHANGQWTITGTKQTVRLDEATLAFQVTAGPANWKMLPSATNDVIFRPASGQDFAASIARASSRTITRYDTGAKTGIKIILSGFTEAQRDSGPTLYLTLALEGKDEDLVFEIAADEQAARVRRLDWPPPLAPESFELSALSHSRGVLLPKTYPRIYHPIRSANPDGTLKVSDTSDIQSNVIEDWSMSWWGFQQGNSAMMLIIETPDDAAYQFDHPAGGPTIIGPRWRTSLGKLGYVRTARMCFIPRGNYVDMAKRYRKYAQETGLFVSLDEKIARAPTVKKLIGSPLMRVGVLTNFKPDGAKAKKAGDASERYKLTKFDQRGEFFRQLKSNGLDHLTVVLTGWPRLGYDRQHPDVLPPAPEAGGYEVMKRLADACRELGYLFSLHDQYRDYYVDAPSFDPQFAVHEEDDKLPAQAFPGSRFGNSKEGTIPFMDHWDGGRMSYLNGRFMLGHLEKNYQGLFDRGIVPHGNYLDVFGYVPPDEDFNPEHPATRTDGLRDRARCYTWSRVHLGFVGTEAACDWTVPYADISSPLNQTKAIPTPLFNLVYHDAIITPYRADDLRGLLNGGMPQIPSKLPTPEELSAIRRMSALHTRLARVEMLRHEFLDPNFKRERTIFADGTTVAVDWDTHTATINPEVE